MWATHVRVRVNDGGGPKYERWKIMEGTGQRSAKGFIKRTLLRSQKDSNVYYYQSFWETPEDPEHFGESDVFQNLAKDYGARDVFADPMLREDSDIIFDDVAAPGVIADASNPWVIHVSVIVNDEADAQERYRRWKILEGTEQVKARGFIKRTLLQSRDRPTHFYYQSFWEAEHFAHEFSATPEFKDLFAKHSPVGVFAVPQVLEQCDVIFDEVAEPVAS
jgi:heme-degrading monooxygenase HmoA